MNSAPDRIPMFKNHGFFSWPWLVVKVLLLMVVAVAMEKPCGSLAGRISLELPGFNLHTYNVREHDVYAVAIGPRGGKSDERGVWVNSDGSFKIDHLPVGEYELKLHAPGFATAYESGIFVDEGDVAHLRRTLALQFDHPQVTMGCNTRIFTTKELPHFWMNVEGCSEATVNVYSTDMMKLALAHQKYDDGQLRVLENFTLYKPWGAKDATEPELFPGLQPIRTWKRAVNSDEWSRQEFKFEKSLPPGDYVAIGTAKNPQGERCWNVAWFNVTDLGLIVKQDKYRTLVRAIDLNTLAPVNGAQVKLLNRSNGKTKATGTTGSDGFISIPTAIHDGDPLLVLGAHDASHAYGGMRYYSSGNGASYKTLFYTDRPVYRLGQTASFKGICRSISNGQMTNPGSNLKLSATVKDPDNNDVKRYHWKTNDHGTFNDIFSIPEDGKTGTYQVVIKYPDGLEDYEQIEVEEYRKPEYQVEVKPITARITAGQKAKVHIKAAYYFGAPVANAKVKYTIFSGDDWRLRYSLMDRPSYYDYFDGWDDDGGYQESSYAGEYVSEGYTVTDSNGEAIVEFDTKKGTYDAESPWSFNGCDRTYRVEAEVTDISRLSVLGNGNISVTNGEYELFVNPDSWIEKVGEPIAVTVKAVAYDGKNPVPNANLHLRLYRRLYDRENSTYRGVRSYEDANVVTDSSGQAHVAFNTRAEFPTDTYEIEATAKDSHDNLIADRSSIWVVSQSSSWMLSSREANKEPLTLTLDKPVYKLGDTAKVMITAPVTGTEGAQAIVTMEGPKLFNHRVVEMKSSAQMIEIPLTDEYLPNAYVAVTLVVKKHQFYEATKIVKISPESHFLKIAIETDKPKYKPGDNATYTIKAAYADGKPAAHTELSLGIVDESIYAVQPDSTPDIGKFFYSRRPNAVVTVCTFPEEYSGGPDKGEPRVRKDFKDTAVWMPVLTTDENGIVQQTIKLPDNLTTWRATVRGATDACDFGEARQKVITTQDLIVRLSLPRFFSQGDKGLITAVVHNYTPTVQSVHVKLGPCENFQFSTALEQTLVVQPDGASRYCWPVVATVAGDAALTCTAIGSTASDALQVKLPIHPLGVEAAIARAGILNGDGESVNIPAALPADAVPGSAHLHVYLSSSSLGQIMGTFSSLIDYPYGCTEQTMSKLMPSVVAIRLSQSVGVPLSAGDKEKFKKVYKQSMDKLNGYQHDDGGWGWWANDTSQVYLTALVLDGYKLLQDAGYTVPEDRKQNGLKWLTTACDNLVDQLADKRLADDLYTRQERTIDLSRAAFVLSRHDRALSASCRNYAVKVKDTLTPEALAYFAMAFSNLHDNERAHVFYSRLIELGNSTTSDAGATLDWSPSRQMFAKLNRKWFHGYYSYRYTDVETTALGLEAVCALEPDNAGRIAEIKQWILIQRGKDGWDNTKTTAEVLRALMLVESQGRRQGGTDFTADFTGCEHSPEKFTAANDLDAERDLILKPASGTQVYTLTKHGTGHLYYNSVLTYYKRIVPGEFVAEQSMPDGLKLRREFFRLKPLAPDSNGNVHFKAEKLQGPVRAGETLLMKVFVDSPEPLPFVSLQAPLPSGAEVVTNDSRENATETQDDPGSKTEDDYYFFGNWWWTHQDVMDDHLAFFVTDLPGTQVQFHQMVRMEIPGKFQINPVTLEGMYTKAVRAHSRADQIEVVE
jgi:uncharacterized protein YfaS (alpha-2-macroglobulin family)